MADFMVLLRPAKSVKNGAGLSGKTGANWACRKGKSGLSATERAVGKNAGAALAKRKRNRAVCPEYQVMRGERVKVGESRTLARAAPWREPHLGESEGDQSEAIFRLRDFVDTEKLKFLYYSLIYSHVQYGIILWGKAINTRQKEIVLRLHNIVRIMI